ncbi:hypothetical protein GCM10010297_59400 [Streptomyces malachitofuscus]|nr:hypothetical protein GCM10010297_59400 [Streptomyces malachitofuscus]
MAVAAVHRPGLDPHGYIVREGSLARVPHAFRPVVAAARERLATLGSRLSGAYLYGSVPRGTARVGRSDLDLLVALHGEPTAGDRDAVRALEERLDRGSARSTVRARCCTAASGC